MRIEHPHALGRTEAIRRIDGAVDALLSGQPPRGVELKDVQKRWEEGRMDLSLKAAKGFFAARIAATIEVSDDRIVIDSPLPPMVASFVGEQRIREAIGRHLDGLLRGVTTL